MHDECRLCWGVPVVGGWVVCKPNLVISDELIKNVLNLVDNALQFDRPQGSTPSRHRPMEYLQLELNYITLVPIL